MRYYEILKNSDYDVVNEEATAGSTSAGNVAVMVSPLSGTPETVIRRSNPTTIIIQPEKKRSKNKIKVKKL